MTSSGLAELRKGFPPGLVDDRVIGRPIREAGLLAPYMTVDLAALTGNIETMARYCDGVGVSLAPHGKTTMSPAVIGRQLAAGAWAITVADTWQALALFTFGVKRVIIANEVVDPAAAAVLAAAVESDPTVELLIGVDSPKGVAIIRDQLQTPAIRDRVAALVEFGFRGGRAGMRDASGIRRVADEARRANVPVAGVMGYEGIIGDRDGVDETAAVDAYLDALGRAFLDLVNAGTLAPGRQPVISAGGSIYFDRVVARLGSIAGSVEGRLVIRSGCYVTHDDGLYEARSPFGRNGTGPFRLRAALTLWAHVLSRPEPDLVIAGFGRRDAPFDHGLPVIRAVEGRGRTATNPDGLTVFALNDQHAFVRVPTDVEIGAGDLLQCGISHPCSAFDRWRSIPLLDPEGVIVDVIETHF